MLRKPKKNIARPTLDITVLDLMHYVYAREYDNNRTEVTKNTRGSPPPYSLDLHNSIVYTFTLPLHTALHTAVGGTVRLDQLSHKSQLVRCSNSCFLNLSPVGRSVLSIQYSPISKKALIIDTVMANRCQHFIQADAGTLTITCVEHMNTNNGMECVVLPNHKPNTDRSTHLIFWGLATALLAAYCLVLTRSYLVV